MGCIKIKAKCEWGGIERMGGRGKQKRGIEEGSPSGKAKKVRSEIQRSKLNKREGGLGVVTIIQVPLQLPIEFEYWMQYFWKQLDRQNQLLKSLVELKKKELYEAEEKELEEFL